MDYQYHGPRTKDALSADFLHNEKILRILDKPHVAVVYLMMRNRTVYSIDNEAVSASVPQIMKILRIKKSEMAETLEIMEKEGFIKSVSEGFSLGVITKNKKGDERINYYYTRAGQDKEDKKQILLFNEEFRQNYLKAYNKEYRKFTPLDRKVVGTIIKLLKMRDLPVENYLDFIFTQVITTWNRDKKQQRLLNLHSLNSKDLLDWYARCIKNYEFPRRPSYDPRDIIEKRHPRPKVRLVKGTLPDDDKPAE